MTEIPEHLLQRSRERRAAMGGGDGGSKEGGDAGGGSSSSAAPAQAASAAPAPSMPAHPEPAAEPPAPPPSPMVQAHQRRHKIPFWAVPVLVALPLWAYVYQGTLEPPPSGEGGPAALGAELYASSGCAGCHGATGGGGVGPAFNGGAVYQTWPSFVDHFHWVRLGSAGWQQQYGDTYGATNKPIGAGGMPGFGPDQISDGELAAIILHERLDLGGADPNPEDTAQLEQVATLLLDNPDMTFEEALAEVGVDTSGTMTGGSEQAAG